MNTEMTAKGIVRQSSRGASASDCVLLGNAIWKVIVLMLVSWCSVSVAHSADQNGASNLVVKNVCLSRLPGYKYSVSNVVDFQLVRAYKKGRKAFTVYVGNNPDLKGPNNRYSARSFIDALKTQYVRLDPPQQGQILGVPTSMYQKYFHVMVSPSNSDYTRIVESVRFCASSDPGPAK